MSTYIVVRSFNDTFKPHKFALNTLNSPLDKVNHIWQQVSFLKDNNLSLKIQSTKTCKSSIACRYMVCPNRCHYKEKFYFDFNQDSLIVYTTSPDQCPCGLARQIKRKTYRKIKSYLSERNDESLIITPTIIQDRLRDAQQNGEAYCIPSKWHLQCVKGNMKRKVILVRETCIHDLL